jgi:hypothetical protein
LTVVAALAFGRTAKPTTKLSAVASAIEVFFKRIPFPSYPSFDASEVSIWIGT